MTAKELIEALEDILDERDGEDLEVRIDVDFVSSYGICNVLPVDDVFDDGLDVLFLLSPEADEACLKHDPRLKIPEKQGLN